MSLYLLLLSFVSLNAHPDSILNDINRCETNRILKKQYCPAEAQIKMELAQVCADPVGYVCKKAPPKGRLLNSKCKINFNDNADAGQTPEVRKLSADIKLATSSFLNAHRTECTKGLVCESYLRMKYREELKKVQIKLAYTPDRTRKINNTFSKVKESAIELIGESKNLSATAKMIMIARIDSTTLRDPYKEEVNSCYFLGSDGADTGIFNEVSVHDPGESKVNFCLGAIAMTDREEESSLVWTLGHELSHSFDPCTMDMLTGGGAHGPSGDDAFNSTNRCLRGGKGPRGCGGGVLHCNDNKSIIEYCESETRSKGGDEFDLCSRTTRKYPNCPWHAPDRDSMSSASYRKGPHAVEQIAESFSDFFGAQIYGRMLVKKNSKNPMSNSEKQDLLVGLGADFASLHGICLNQNTNDEHPPGRIRLQNNLLANPEFAKTLCPATPRTTCENL
ncbi:MAG: hypothetical protein H7333_12375 [Bdellovibrionales bacterium]|nr:hypothetical protein [Oligoflexia bacterium]